MMSMMRQFTNTINNSSNGYSSSQYMFMCRVCGQEFYQQESCSLHMTYDHSHTEHLLLEKVSDLTEQVESLLRAMDGKY